MPLGLAVAVPWVAAVEIATVDALMALAPAVSLLRTLIIVGVFPFAEALSAFAVGGSTADMVTLTVAGEEVIPLLPVTV